MIKKIKMEVSPLDVYKSIIGENTFLLESAEGVPKIARYSILGKAEGKIEFRNGKLKITPFTEFGEKIKHLENVKLEVFIGEFDKIIASKKAFKFFSNFGDVYFIKKANHFLRS